MDHARLIAELRAERDELAERVRQLEAILRDDAWVPTEWELTGSEVIILNMLATRELATKDALLTALYGDDPDGGANEKILDVFILKLRRKLAPRGLHIETAWGQGHRLTKASRRLTTALRREQSIARTDRIKAGLGEYAPKSMFGGR
jgi:two-component system cell cycle response regulator CtrA